MVRYFFHRCEQPTPEKLYRATVIVFNLFQVFQVYSNNQELEMDRLRDTFSTVSNKSKVHCSQHA